MMLQSQLTQRFPAKLNAPGRVHIQQPDSHLAGWRQTDDCSFLKAEMRFPDIMSRVKEWCNFSSIRRDASTPTSLY